MAKACGSVADAGRIKGESGFHGLQSTKSIMHFDRPAASSPGNRRDKRREGTRIDTESVEVLQCLYPKIHPVFAERFAMTHVQGWREGIPGDEAVKSFAAPQTANVVSGLCHLDMGLNGSFRLWTGVRKVQPRLGFDFCIKSWDDTHIINAESHIMSFDPDDHRVQTGEIDLNSMRGDDRPEGVRREKYIQFPRPFKQMPNVVTFLTGLDTIKGRWLRVNCLASSIGLNGFYITLMTWAGQYHPLLIFNIGRYPNHSTNVDTIAYNINASWLAHEIDEPTIRSGNFGNTPGPAQTMDYKHWHTFTSPMRRRPRKMFFALSSIDVQPHHNIRLHCEAEKWDENGVEGRFFTWLEESKFYALRGSYVAIM